MKHKEKGSKRFITPGGAGLAAICFFLPWLRACGQDLSGKQIASQSESALWFILIASVAIIVGFFVFEGQNNLTKLKPIVLLGAIVSLLIMLAKYVQFTQKEASGVFEIQYGAIGTIIGFVASLVGVQFLEDDITTVVAKPASQTVLPKGKTLTNETSCHKCRAVIGEGARFCSGCGASVDISCLKCGAMIEVDCKFCSECGASVHEAVLPVQEKPVAP